MLTVTFPTAELRALYGEPGPDVRLGVWDPMVDDEPTDVPLDEVDVALAPDYVTLEPFTRLARAPRLRFLQLTTAGYEHTRGLLPASMTVANGRGVHSDETAELALALTLASLRGLDVYVRNMGTQHWEDTLVRRPSLAASRVLVIGAGSIGQEVVARMRACKAEVTVVARTTRVVDGLGTVHGLDELADLVPQADVVVIIIPLTDSSAGLVDAAFLGRMHDGALLVNVSRGGVVRTDALLAELASGRLRAALDVTDPEPLPVGHPLWSAPNVLITPHVGGNTPLTEVRVTELMRRQVAAILAGRGLENVVAGEAQIGLAAR